MGILAAGASRTISANDLPAGSSGYKSFRAFVDGTCSLAESSETNNQRTQSYRVTGVSDFAITAVSLNPTTPTANAAFSVTITVTNRGSQAADAGNLSLWADRPAEAVCGSASDSSTRIGTLAANASKTVTLGLSAGAAGSKTFRAFIDSRCRTAESNEANNRVAQPYFVKDSSSSGQQWVKGYYVAYQRDLLPPEQIRWSGMTEIVMGRITANADGTLNDSFDIGAPQGPDLARTISSSARQNGVKPILMLGGDGNGEAILSAVRDHRGAFIANLVAATKDLGYDGIDLDWENNVDLSLFVTFAQELRLAAPGMILSVPVGTLNSNYDVVDPRFAELARHVDQLNMMSYHPATSWAGEGWYSWHNSPLSGVKPNTPVSIEDSLARYAAAGIPKARLGMGISFYAIGYLGGILAPNQPTQSNSIVGGDNAYPLSLLFGPRGAHSPANLYWDEQAKCTFLSLPAPAQPDQLGARYISFEDERSILEKGNFSRTNGYGGIIVWTINQGNVTTHTNPGFLMDALRQGFIAPDEPLAVAVSTSPARIWVQPGDSIQLKALVTGSNDPGVAWNVQETAGGTVNENGLYTAPPAAPQGGTATFHVIATSQADPSKAAVTDITVTNNLFWDPVMTSYDRAEWWMSVFSDDTANVESVFVEHNGVVQQMMPWGTVWPDKPAFSISTQIPEGDMIRFLIYGRDGRTARTYPIPFVYGNGYSACPIEGPIP